jgi:hypothetical protein
MRYELSADEKTTLMAEVFKCAEIDVNLWNVEAAACGSTEVIGERPETLHGVMQ